MRRHARREARHEPQAEVESCKVKPRRPQPRVFEPGVDLDVAGATQPGAKRLESRFHGRPVPQVHGCRLVHDGTITVSVSCDGQRIRLKVQDPSDEQPRLQAAGEDEMSGRGMLLVQAFADRWGVEAPSEGAGKSVWMEMSCTPASGQEAA